MMFLVLEPEQLQYVQLSTGNSGPLARVINPKSWWGMGGEAPTVPLATKEPF